MTLFLTLNLVLATAFPVIAASPVIEGNEKRKQNDTWWSFRPLERPAVPNVDGEILRNPIDAFVRSNLAALGLAASPETDRRTLIRRLYFDLIGLPPTLEEVEVFIKDSDPFAYERLVERLLDSPHYGERWARHWLDVVHYGDTHGYDKDQPRANAWPYRDYVIRSFNSDKPYSRFIQEQIAGDVLFPGSVDGIEALGFIAAGPWDLIGHAEVQETKIDGKIARHLDRDDMVANTMSTFNSLTVHCAQCHNHKFDPIPSEDYYSLQAVFAALDRTNFEYYADPDLTEKRKELKVAARTLTDEKSAIEAEIKQYGALELQQKLSSTTNQIALVNEKLAAMPNPRVAFIGAIHYGSGAFRGTGPDGGKPRRIHLLRRGDVRQTGELVSPGALSAIKELPARFVLSNEHPEGWRRRELALWLTEARNPLTWRSVVNRVWQYHFGRGLVETPNDFGRMGALPSHPDLLDWLAVEFREGGQSFKALHRLILTSSTYRQSSSVLDESRKASEKDSDNRYLWRMNRRRLEAESIRDTILFVSGSLDARMFGPGFQDFVIEKPEHSPHYQYHLHDPNDPKSHRRSIYRFIVRSQPQPLMTTLDCADPSMLVDRRNESLTALQALALLNSGLTVAMSHRFADDPDLKAQPVEGQIQRAFSRALSRPPNDSELATLTAYARRHGLANACRLLFNMNEFTFVD
jgi:hypothetical protein